MNAQPDLTGAGETPRCAVLPYGRQWIDEDDIAAVAEALRSDWLTTGPLVGEFERAFASAVGAREGVAVNSGTAALHAAMFALEVGPGDEVIVPPLTFAATANCVVYQGATPVFADIHSETLLLDPERVAERITPRTRAIITVDYAGQPSYYDALRGLAERHGLALVADACHAPGATDDGRPVGSLADLNTFSFHPVKHIATGEGGMVTTHDPALAARMRQFRNHGITTDHRQREAAGSWYYQMTELGYNYRMPDILCALGLSQLGKQAGWLARRREIAAHYDAAFAEVPEVRPVAVRPGVRHAYHLYPVRVSRRAEVFAALRAEGIGVNVHYVPVHLHPYYRQRFGTGPGLCPVAESAYEELLSLPLFPRMMHSDENRVIDSLSRIMKAVPRKETAGKLRLGQQA